MALGQIYTIPSGSSRLVVAQSHTEVPSIGVLNPNDGIAYLKLNGPAGSSPPEWDWKLPSQSYGFFPGPWTSLGVYFLDQSGSNRSGEINVYESQQRFADIPNIQAIGRAIQQAGTTMDITTGGQPQNPPINTGRLWIDAAGNLHLLDSTGDDATVLDSSNYGAAIIAGGDASGPIGATKVLSTHIPYGTQAYVSNSAGVDKRWLQYTGDGYTSFHAGDTGLLLVNQANTVRYMSMDNSTGICTFNYGIQVSSAIGLTGNFTITSPAGSNYGNFIYKSSGAVVPGNYNDGSHLQLQSPDGYSPRIGFHTHGVVGWVLYTSSDANNPLHIMSNAGNNYPIVTTSGVQTLVNKNLKWTYVVPGNGAVLSYACFHILQVSGGTWYMPASAGHAGEMIIAKNWVGAAVTIACQGGSVFGVGGGTGAPTSLVLQYGDSYTFMSDGGAGWMLV